MVPDIEGASKYNKAVLPSSDKWEFQEVTDSEILSILQELPPKKSAGPDRISYNILKTLRTSVTPFIRKLLIVFSVRVYST